MFSAARVRTLIRIFEVYDYDIARGRRGLQH